MTNFKVLATLAICCLHYVQAQNSQRVLSITDQYPLFNTENVTVKNSEICSCQANFSLADWGKWSKCHGELGKRKFSCHNGVRFRSRKCSEGKLNFCQNREWRRCYHSESCQGQWVVWNDEQSSCSATKRQKVTVRICEEDNQIGLFCVGNKRIPYEVAVEPCAEAVYQPNHSTWIAAGAGFVVGVIMVSIIVCANRCSSNEQKKTSQDTTATDQVTTYTPNKTNEVNSNPTAGSVASTLRRPVTLDTQYYNTTSLKYKKQNPSLATPVEQFPEAPPELRHSFINNHPVTSEQAVYSVPSPKCPPYNEWDIQGGNTDLGMNTESSTRFCDDIESSTNNHTLPVSFSADNYMDTLPNVEYTTPLSSTSRKGSAPESRAYGIFPHCESEVEYPASLSNKTRKGSAPESRAYGVLPHYEYNTTTLPKPDRSSDGHVYAEISGKARRNLKTFG